MREHETIRQIAGAAYRPKRLRVFPIFARRDERYLALSRLRTGIVHLVR
jgi:hypothetical protein